MATFTWVEDQGTSASVKPRVHSAKFGDGYQQVAKDGINNLQPEYKVKFSLLNQATYQAILDFLESHAGATAFDWTPYGRTAGKYRCDDWDYSFNITGDISATFRQVML